MARLACVVVLAAVVSRAAANEAHELRSVGGAAPFKIWSINAELDMNQQTDVSVRGPRDMYVAHEDHQNKIRLDNSEAPRDPRRVDVAAAVPPRQADPLAAGPAKPRLVVATKGACCQGCEAPPAVHLLHALAHGLGMLVVLCMWVLLVAAILIRFC